MGDFDGARERDRAAAERLAHAQAEVERMREQMQRERRLRELAQFRQDLSARNAAKVSYEASWEAFATAVAAEDCPPITMAQVPWPDLEAHVPWDAHYLGLDPRFETRGADDVRLNYRTLVKRWHPDRFAQSIGPLLADEDREAVLQRAVQLSQRITEIMNAQK